jgi:hypothetical protein
LLLREAGALGETNRDVAPGHWHGMNYTKRESGLQESDAFTCKAEQGRLTGRWIGSSERMLLVLVELSKSARNFAIH